MPARSTTRAACRRKIVAPHQTISLSARDSIRILDLLENPPKPTAALLAAARRKRRRV